jgi:hypothetical protein
MPHEWHRQARNGDVTLMMRPRPWARIEARGTAKLDVCEDGGLKWGVHRFSRGAARPAQKYCSHRVVDHDVELAAPAFFEAFP